MDTVSNATVNAGAESPAALVELGIMTFGGKNTMVKTLPKLISLTN